MQKRMKKVLIIFTALTILLTISVVSASLYVGHKVSNPSKKSIRSFPNEYGMFYEDIAFESKDNVQLKGWWIPATVNGEEKRTVIFSHGYGYNRENMPFETLKLTKRLTSEGYNVLMFDFRNSGESEEADTTIGRNEKQDLMSAIRFAKKQKNSDDIFLIGWSMGAATSIIAASESKDVKAVIADSPFSDLGEYAEDSFSYWTGLPKFMGKIITTLNGAFTELKADEVKPYIAAKNLGNKPLLLIHGKKDGAIPYKESKNIYNEAIESGVEVDIWLTKKGGHIRAYKHFQNEYEDKVLNFLNQH